MTTLLPENSPIIKLKETLLPKHHDFPEKPLQDWIEKETEAQLTAPRQKELTTELISRKELTSFGEHINTIRSRIHNTYQNQLNPPLSVEEAIWRYINSEYPSESEEEKKRVYKALAQTSSSIITHEFDYVRSGQEYAVLAQRRLPLEKVDAATEKLISSITKSVNIPNAISTIVDFVEKKSDEASALTLDDNRLWLQLDLDVPAVWNNEFVLENPPHILYDQNSIRVGVICNDEKSKETIQQDVIYDQAFSFQFLTFTELRRNFIQGPRFKALTQSYDIVLIEDSVFEQLRILKLSEHQNLFPIDFTKGREEYERIMNSITFRVIDAKERLRIDFGRQSWEKDELVENCKFAIEKLGYYAPWGFKNIKAISINCESAPQLFIYKKPSTQVEGKLFKKSKGIIPESLKNVTQFVSSGKNIDDLEIVAEPVVDDEVESEDEVLEAPVVEEKKEKKSDPSSKKRKRNDKSGSNKRTKTK